MFEQTLGWLGARRLGAGGFAVGAWSEKKTCKSCLVERQACLDELVGLEGFRRASSSDAPCSWS